MKDILKTLIVDNSVKKWTEFLKFNSFFQGRDKYFDQSIIFIEKYFSKYTLFPKYSQFTELLNSSNEDQFLSYVAGVCESDIPVYNSEEEFVAALVVSQKTYLEQDIITTINGYSVSYGNLGAKNKDSILESVDDLITDLYKVKYKVSQNEDSTSSLVYGSEAVNLFKKLYAKIEEKKMNSEAFYFDIGVPGLENVLMKRGDFVVIGGYTSHGKSVWLRHILYRFLTKYHMNCCLFSLEMKHDNILEEFYLLHANNKEIFPNTPYISNEKFNKGELSSEEKDFLFDLAVKDFAKEEKYGSIYIDQPNKSKYSLLDMQMKVKFVESTIMPVHVVGQDYLSLFYPIIDGRRSPDMEDYNQMVKDTKNYGLTHTTREGVIDPLIIITPAQISRKAMAEALKNDGRYTLDCIRYYYEMEASADVAFSTLLTDAMRLSGQLRIQNLKNRDGRVIVDPIDVRCDFSNGYTIGELGVRSDQEILEILQSIEI